MMRAIALAVGLLLTLGACAHVRPPPAEGCVIKAYPIRSETEPVTPVKRGPGVLFYDEVVQRALAKRASMKFAGQRLSMLLLSGGGPEGAFGAGLLYGLPARVEPYDVVTGVSSGALQATLAFLPYRDGIDGRKLDPPDYGDGVYELGKTNLEDLAVAYSISQESTLLDVRRPHLLAALTKGGIGSLAPLRRRMVGLASDETLKKVGKHHKDGRRLLVGVTNLDDGVGYALDLGDLGLQVYKGADADVIRECYVDALVASSANPAAAPPVMLRVSLDEGRTSEEHLYIDGGARYGVFLIKELAGVAEKKPPANVDVTVIVNGALYGGAWYNNDGKPVDEWTTLQLYGRSVEVLANQVYRFSVDDAARYVRVNGGEFRLAYLSNDRLEKYKTHPDDHPYTSEVDHVDKTKTCSEWRKYDDKAKPFKFRPKYMACLIDYGRERGNSDPWNFQFSVPPPQP